MRRQATPHRSSAVRRRIAATVLTSSCLILSTTATSQTLEGAAHELSGRSIIQRINQRGAGRAIAHRMRLRMRSPNGHERERGLLAFRSFLPKSSQLAFYATSPPDMRNMSYVVHDFFDPKKADNQWVFTPRRDAPRRLPETNLKESFLGSEFTLEDVKKLFRIEVDDYEWELREKTTVGGRTLYLVEQRPASTELAKRLGVSRMRNLIDGKYWVRIEVETWDLDGRPLKLFQADLEDDPSAGAFGVRRILAKNLQSRAESEIVFEATKIDPEIPDWVFTPRGMLREDVGALEKLVGP